MTSRGEGLPLPKPDPTWKMSTERRVWEADRCLEDVRVCLSSLAPTLSDPACALVGQLLDRIDDYAIDCGMYPSAPRPPFNEFRPDFWAFDGPLTQTLETDL